MSTTDERAAHERELDEIEARGVALDVASALSGNAASGLDVVRLALTVEGWMFGGNPADPEELTTRIRAARRHLRNLRELQETAGYQIHTGDTEGFLQTADLYRSFIRTGG